MSPKSLVELAREYSECPDNSRERELLGMLIALHVSANPSWDNIVISYIGATNNIDKVIYSLNGNTTLTLTFAYAANGAADDDLLTNIVKS